MRYGATGLLRLLGLRRLDQLIKTKKLGLGWGYSLIPTEIKV